MAPVYARPRWVRIVSNAIAVAMLVGAVFGMAIGEWFATVPVAAGAVLILLANVPLRAGHLRGDRHADPGALVHRRGVPPRFRSDVRSLRGRHPGVDSDYRDEVPARLPALFTSDRPWRVECSRSGPGLRDDRDSAGAHPVNRPCGRGGRFRQLDVQGHRHHLRHWGFGLRRWTPPICAPPCTPGRTATPTTPA